MPLEEEQLQRIEEAMQRYREAQEEAKAAGERAQQVEEELRGLFDQPSEESEPGP